MFSLVGPPAAQHEAHWMVISFLLAVDHFGYERLHNV
jgi:hypothetical protein